MGGRASPGRTWIIGRGAIAAQCTGGSTQHPQQQQRFAAGDPASSSNSSSSFDPGLEAFKSLVGSKRFTCTQCGKCCTGDGEVWISDAEAVAIARHLNLPLQRFHTQHTRAYSKVKGYHMLRCNLDSQARECTFLRPDNICAVHPVRPLQCATYPWWPELMNDQEWAWERENICEGFDHADAPPTDLSDAAQQLKLATAQEYAKMLATKPSKKRQQQQPSAGQLGGADSSSSSVMGNGHPTAAAAETSRQ